MNSIQLKILNEKAGRPLGNPFNVRTVEVNEFGGLGGYFEIKTGIAITVFKDMTLSFNCLIDNAYILGHRMDLKTGEFIVLIIKTDETPISDFSDFAEVTIVERNYSKIRFVEIQDGSRVITGGPKETDSNG